MTFDIAPHWLDDLTATPGAPTHPSMAQMAALVGELFAEGSLSFEQLRSLSNVPELERLLGDAVDHVPPARRLSAARR